MISRTFKNVFLFLLLFCASCTPSSAEWAKVRHVVDGDTVVLETNQIIRLIGVDTPEIKSEYNPQDDYYGPEAAAFLEDLVEGKTVRLAGERMQKPFDKYGRRLAYIYLKDGMFVNRELVRLGYAEAIRYFPYAHKKDFLSLEKQARRKSLGMWGRFPGETEGY